ncbi:uncharacterized protein LOC111004616 isoform X1 [Momordica charantia]|uniref:Uncharacterized protein LOC111004616 isoform X1 n=1 Tax=Momordica charantia TaxID=3673 RepID=A0A6J1BQ36_MOMCH|nr:uncharacterized protein LOC111004616 isoform X1 [Momordica charantia]XP_022131380.1 uncharacterized protein LOC111004616 isoform X1 [Momordica charantia]
MLRKRTRSVQKDQYIMNQLNAPCSGSELHHPKCSSIFKRCHLFTGLSPKGSDSDSAKSPTSPLDFWVFSGLGNPLRSPRSSSNEGHRKNWDSSKVGLSIIDSLDDDSKLFGKVLRSSDSKTVLFGPRSVAKTVNCPSWANLFQGPKSLPKNYAISPLLKTKSPIEQGNSDVIFEIGETPLESEPFGKNYSRSFDSYRSFALPSGLTGHSLGSSTTTESLASPRLADEHRDSEKCPLAEPCLVSLGVSGYNGFKRPLSATEIELSEDYTCVISHGPNPKTTHIFGDCILECHSNYLSSSSENEMKDIGLPHPVKSLDISTSYSLSDFLSFCYSCHKKLEEGKDIYIYRFTQEKSFRLLNDFDEELTHRCCRGEKAFCSLTCRSQEILMDEELEKSIDKTSETSPKSNADHDEDLFGISIGGFA